MPQLKLPELSAPTARLSIPVRLYTLPAKFQSTLATGNIPEGIEAQSEQAMRNVEAILAQAGLTTDNVVKTTVFLSDMANFAAMNTVYAAHFNEPYPARSAVAVRELPKGVLVEVEVIAVR